MPTRAKAQALALVGLVAFQSTVAALVVPDAQISATLGGTNLTEAAKALLTNPFASHNWTTKGPNGTSDYTHTITVVDSKINDTTARPFALLSLTAPAGVDLADWELLYEVVVPDYNQTWIDLFDRSDSGDCRTAFSDACLRKLTEKSLRSTRQGWPEECPSPSSGAYGLNSTATSMVNDDSWAQLYMSPHDINNKTLVNMLASSVFPITFEWSNYKTGKSSRSVSCVRASVPSASASPSPSPSPTTGTPSATGNIAGPTAAVKKEYLLGAAAVVVGYMAY
ncbi:hypothetical protein JX265_010295 [Neoarthrinium moseri]|uniref:Uncharacterized protein n=1 Tax=Neoarthrinium moseri TaxID=1658444 RepID=A0A9Q0ALV3_9PEZI|nr:uncharacterized protein JN550_003506 [Neoarthrinium moseri]KAI1859846.1 hypothetical protein JX265_010295 [Neoarthrinium moseri]KAI1873253.1 hypothetical protein JN550_003506 [Neoarthrinium moseri]